MAAPAEINILNLTGKWVMNKTLSDDTSDVLTLQGVSWFKRQIIAIATVTLHVTHYKDDAGVEHIDIKQTITGGIEGTEENRTLDWTVREHTDHLFGPVAARSRHVALAEIDNAFLTEGWLPEIAELGTVHAIADSKTEESGLTWHADQTWGFEEINDERRYVRHLDFTSKGEHLQKRLVYDYVGPNDA